MRLHALLPFFSSALADCKGDSDYRVDNNWYEGSGDGKNQKFESFLTLHLPDHDIDSWDITVHFKHSVVGVQVWDADAAAVDADSTIWRFTPKSWDEHLNADTHFEFKFQGRQWEDYEIGHIWKTDFCSPDGVGNGGQTTTGSTTRTTRTTTTNSGPTVTPDPGEITTTNPNSLCSGPSGVRGGPEQSIVDFKRGSYGKYDINEVLHKSILFYEAQRCGKNSNFNRVLWRGDSGMKDGCDVGHNLDGGWFDAGDHVKFGFPMAFTTTLLGWGMIDYKAEYEHAGEYINALNMIRWPLEFFIRAHTGKNEFYGQVGDGYADHGFWGRPEDMNMARPAFKVTEQCPGSDLVGETAAALATGYLIFKDLDSAFANECLSHAKELYDFAYNFRGKYSDCIPASDFYNSWGGYNDELAWGAAWLYRATGDDSYLAKSNEFYSSGLGDMFSWDDKTAGTALLLAQLTSNSKFVNDFNQFANYIKNQAPRTPKGLVWLSQWGSNRYAANDAFLIMHTNKVARFSDGAANLAFGKGQIDYMLGDSGRSFVVGFGNNPPERPHHRSSSCPPVPQDCNNGAGNPGPNPMVLYGALVGGPDQYDNYVDDRNDYVANEVATDYNAGFQSALVAYISDYM
ncbi:unnamed protein product [Oikopleura dioica]|uniref:Endoglucanase n=1 Tax=Oikopleura dioica TaxID=34765 RepID=E4XNV0_OIKDI|nr:unnamed protein product [Oikopleura dioica]